MKLLRYLFTIDVTVGLLMGTTVGAATIGKITLEDVVVDDFGGDLLGFQGNIAQPFTITSPSTTTAATTTNLFGDFLPQANNAYDIGKVATKWRYGFFSSVSSTSSTADNFYAGNGSISAPSYSWKNDTDSGWFFDVTSSTINTVINGEILTRVSSTELNIRNGNWLTLGNASDVKLAWNTADANANSLVLTVPQPDGVNVPVFAVVSSSAAATDLGLFDTFLTPSLAVVSNDNSKYLALRSGNTNPMLDANATALLASSGNTTALWSSTRFQVQDDKFLSLGTGADAQFIWETADANANALILQLTRDGAGTTVPVFAVASTSANNVDLGLFDTWTNPTFAMLGTGNTNYLRLYNNNIDSVIDSLSGTLIFQVASSTVAVVSSTALATINGTVANPSIGFINDTDSGLFLDTTTSTLNIVKDGVLVMGVSSSAISLFSGTAANPSLTFLTDTNSGLFSSANDILGLSTKGTARQVWSSTSTYLYNESNNQYIQLGNNGTDAVYNIPSGQHRFQVASTSILRVTDNSVNVVGDNIEFGIGVAPDGKFEWATNDPNANNWRFFIGEGSSVNVPVFSFSDVTSDGANWGFFDGIQDPTIAIISDDSNQYLRFYNNGIDSVIDTLSGALRLQITSSTVAVVSTTSISLINGTLANPSYSFTNDTNSGLKIDVTTSSLDLVKDGFIVYSATSSASGGKSVFSGNFGYTPIATTTLSATHSITTTGRIMRLQGDGGAVVISSTAPTVQPGFHGQIVEFVGTSDTNTVEIQDNLNQTSDSGLRLSGNVDFTLGLNDVIELQYDSVAAVWQERFRSDN